MMRVPVAVTIAVVAMVLVGIYAYTTFPSETTRLIPPITVYFNQIIVPGTAGQIAFIGENRSESLSPIIWQMKIGNNQRTSLLVDVGLYADRKPIAYNNTEIRPSGLATISYCGFESNINVPFVAQIFGSSSQGTVTPQYPVSVFNATRTGSPNQVSISSNLHGPVFNETYGSNFTIWRGLVSNTGNRSVQSIFLFLANGYNLILYQILRCAGTSSLSAPGPMDYGMPLGSGQGAAFSYFMAYDAALSGKTLSVIVMAVYDDNSAFTEVVPISFST